MFQEHCETLAFNDNVVQRWPTISVGYQSKWLLLVVQSVRPSLSPRSLLLEHAASTKNILQCPVFLDQPVSAIYQWC